MNVKTVVMLNYLFQQHTNVFVIISLSGHTGEEKILEEYRLVDRLQCDGLNS